MVLDASLLNTQHYKVRIKGKVKQSREGVAPSLHLGVVAIEKGAFGSPSTMVANFTLLLSRVKRSNPEKGVAPSPTPRCTSYWKGSLPVAVDYATNYRFKNSRKDKSD